MQNGYQTRSAVSKPEVCDICQAELRSAGFPDVLQVVIDNAMDGRIQFVKLILELTEKYSRVTTLQGDQPQIGIERYADLIKQIETWEQERVEGRNGN
jgi:hypothetical protein